MSTFANRMLEAKRAKQEARNRGESPGDFRGTVRPLTAAERAELDADMFQDWLDVAFAKIAWGIAHDRAQERADLEWYLLENRDPAIHALASADAIPF